MALKIRLARYGRKKLPYYHIVVAENTSKRDGKFVEKVGTYNPLADGDKNNRVSLIEDRIKYWLSSGAKPTDRVSIFLGQANIIPMPNTTDKPKKSLPKKKAQEKLKQDAEKLKLAEEAEKANKAAENQEAPETEDKKK